MLGIACLLCLSLYEASAQSSATSQVQPASQLSLLLSPAPPSIKLNNYWQPLAAKSPVDAAPDLRTVFQPKLGQNNQPGSASWGYCADDLAFFCRLEVKLEKATVMPVRFRLGSTQYVDYLEGKFEGWRYGY